MDYYRISFEDLFRELDSSPDGLKSDAVQKNIQKFGKNEIKKARKNPLIFDFVEQFTNLFALILIFAGFLSLLLGNGRDAVVLFFIVFLNAIIGFFQEFKAERTIEALQKIIPKEATVRREGKARKISVSEVVVGDIVLLQPGDTVPADTRLIKAYNLKTNDFVLTGESVSQEKYAGELKNSKETSLTDRDNCVFTGMEVVDGSAEGIVFAVGMETEFGKIAGLTQQVKREDSPLQKEINQIGSRVTKLVAVIIPIMFGVFYISNKGQFNFFNAFEFSIGVSSAMVPEGLAATVSITLAIGIQRVAKKRAVIRKLSSAETLGSTSVIVTDKTGTLTKNEMTVKEIYASDHSITVGGIGYIGKGGFRIEGEKIKIFDTERFQEIFKAAVLCNNADITFDSQGNGTKPIGDQMEVSFLVLARKAGYFKQKLMNKYKRVFEIAFDSKRKMMSVVVADVGKNIVYTKGGSLEVLSRCDRILENGKIRKIQKSDIQKIKLKNDEYAQDALRVLGLAFKNIKIREKYATAEVENNLIFIGLLGIIDPPREDVAGALLECRQAGIRTFMVTGDYGLTASAIAKKIGLCSNPFVVTGLDLSTMNDFDLGKILNFGVEGYDGVVFARTAPEDKLRIVTVLKSYGEVVAVTGDGVNDAPALKKADIGVAMGITGTDVSKEASEMITLDDNFSSIVSAIKEGRAIYENIKKFIYYIFSSNGTEFFVVLIGSLFGLMPIFAIQILLIDLCTDIFPSLALAVDPPEKGIMKKPPRNPRGKLLDFDVFRSLVSVGIVGGSLGFFVFVTVLLRGGWAWGSQVPEGSLLFQATAATYATLVICQIFNSIESRSQTLGFRDLVLGNKKLLGGIGVSIFLLLNIIYNPYVQPFAKTAAFDPVNWFVILTAGLIFLLSVEHHKKHVRDREDRFLNRLKFLFSDN